MSSPTIDDVRAAAARIAPYAHRTPVLTCAAIDALAGRRIFFKCEHLQKVGAFKFRGACNAVMALADDEARRGVVTHSSGNHAQALALAARLRGIAAYIVMPSNAAAVKQRAVAGYGAEVILCEPTLAAREATAARVQRDSGATMVHPYDNAFVIAGQGTAALELLDQVDNLDAVVTPVGGGGLLSGSCVTVRALAPHVRVFAGEPEGADDAARSLAAGQLLPQTDPCTIADGLLTGLGNLNWPIIREGVERIFTVSDAATVAAMRLAWERGKLMIEPSSAVALAAVLSQPFQSMAGIERVAVILSGGNIDVDRLPW